MESAESGRVSDIKILPGYLWITPQWQKKAKRHFTWCYGPSCCSSHEHFATRAPLTKYLNALGSAALFNAANFKADKIVMHFDYALFL